MEDLDRLDYDEDTYPPEFIHHTSCCGVEILSGFSAVNKGNLSVVDDATKYKELIEVTLTDKQMMQWAPELKKRGFRLHARWKNPNSGNYCNLLSHSIDDESTPPYKW